jgi:hypothetical protein
VGKLLITSNGDWRFFFSWNMQKDQTFPGGDFVAFDPIQCDLIRDGVDSLKHVSNLEIGILKSKNRDRFVWGADEHVQRTQ